MMSTDLARLSATIETIENTMGVAPHRQRRKAKRIGTSKRKLVRREYTKDRGYLLMLGYWRPDDITAPSHTFIASPQVPFRPRRLVLNEIWGAAKTVNENMKAWQVDDIKIASKSQFVEGTGGFPASAFVPEASEVLFKFDTCGIGQEITVTISSVSPTDFISFEPSITAGMIGHAADS